MRPSRISISTICSTSCSPYRDVLSVDTATILLLDPGGLRPRCAGVGRLRGSRSSTASGSRSGRGSPAGVAAERSGRSCSRRSSTPTPSTASAYGEKGLATMLGVPLLVGPNDRRSSRRTLTPREFDTADVDLLQLVADRAVISIEHESCLPRSGEARSSARETRRPVTDVALAHLELHALLAVDPRTHPARPRRRQRRRATARRGRRGARGASSGRCR